MSPPIRASTAAGGEAAPVAVRPVDLEFPMGDLQAGVTSEGVPYGDARLLVRLHQEPLGVVDLALRDGVAARDEVAAAVLREQGDRIRAHLAQSGCGPAGPLGVREIQAGLASDGEGCPADPLEGYAAPRVDVIIPTAGRPKQVRACLEGLRGLAYPDFRVLVVDNRPQDGATRAVLAEARRHDDRLVYIPESRPGSSVARNRGVAESSADLLAFTDDDVLVDPHWLSWLVRPFLDDPEVTVVTGLVMPADMQTPAQRRFEDHSGFGKGFERRVFDLRDHGAAGTLLFPYWGATFGSGNSMAFRREQLLRIGGFDPALGAGSRALAGADIESFTHAILDGGRLVYEPRALCWHDHRSDEAAFQRQLFSYWVSFTAILTKWALRRPWDVGGAVLRALPAVIGLNRRDGRPVPREVERLRGQLRMSARTSTLGHQLKGYAVGPLLYVRSRRWARRLRLADALTRPAPVEAGMPATALAAPVALRTIDLDAPLLPVVCDEQPYRSLMAVVRLDGRPFGAVSLPVGPEGLVPAQVLASAVRSQLEAELTEALAARGEALPATLPEGGFAARPPQRVEPEPAITVVVPTVRNPVALERCVRSILASDHGRLDVVVVENRPGTDVTRSMLERHFADDGRVRYAEEARPGASWARNRGLELATGEIVAFIDDDVVVDPGALRTAAHAFADEAIGCVTGLILPLSLDSPAQVLHEQISTFGKGFRATRFSLPETRSLNPLFPYTPGHVGSGANTLLRTGLARRLGGFDTRLGPATPSLGGEEIDLYVRVLRSGAAIAYDPGIVVWHEHPDDLRRLDRYAFRFGVGLGAMLAKQLVAGPERLRLLRLTPAGVGYALDPTSRKNALKGQDYPSRLDVIERLGMLAGPACYLASVARARAGGALARRRGRRTSPPSPSSTGADQR